MKYLWPLLLAVLCACGGSGSPNRGEHADWTAVDAALADARRHDAALAQAQRDEPARFDAFSARIPVLDQRIQALIPRVAALSREEQQVAQDLAVAALTQQKERLAIYTSQARFAVAQLVDRSNLEKGAEHAAKP